MRLHVQKRGYMLELQVRYIPHAPTPSQLEEFSGLLVGALHTVWTQNVSGRFNLRAVRCVFQEK